MRYWKRLSSWSLAAVAGLFVESAAHAAGSRPVESDREVASNCRLLGKVRGDSGFGKHLQASWLELARDRAMKKATALGATHVVWEGRRARGAFNGHVDAGAYACK